MIRGKLRVSASRNWAVAGSLAAVMFLGGCSYVPDAVNPVEWWKGVQGWFTGDDNAQSRQSANTQKRQGAQKTAPVAGKPFPKLGTVPRTPAKQATAAEQRLALSKGLVADRKNARYADARLRAGRPIDTAAAPSPKPAASPAPRRQANVMPNVPPPPPMQRDRLAPPPRISAPALRTRPTPPPLSPPPPAARPAPAFAKPGSEIAALPQLPKPSAGAGVRTAANAKSKGVVRQGRSLDEFDASGKGVSMRVAMVSFGNGSAKLKQAARGEIREAVRLHRQYGGNLRVIGHASSRTKDMDPVRHRMVNFGISVDRARIVARALIRAGVAPTVVFVGAQSDSQPMYYEAMPAGEAGNRRVEIYVDY